MKTRVLWYYSHEYAEDKPSRCFNSLEQAYKAGKEEYIYKYDGEITEEELTEFINVYKIVYINE